MKMISRLLKPRRKSTMGCIDIPTDKDHDIQLAKKKISKSSSVLLRFHKPQVLLN